MSAHTRLIALPLAAAALVAPATAQAVVEPGGGSNFGSGAQGWSSTSATCQPDGGLLGELCDAANSHDGGAGNPPGSLRSRLDVETGLVRFDSGFTWRSPSFVVGGDPGATVEGAEIAVDRRFDIAGIAGLDPEATVEVAIVDETSGGRTEVISEPVDADDSVFDTTSAAMPPGALTRGNTHHIELAAEVGTTTTLGATSGTANVRYDNVSLQIPDPPGNSPGVRFVAQPVNGPAINALINGLDVHALKGTEPGGSLVPRDDCTILGTDGADRITATTGNDVICALGGNDKVSGRDGRDIVDDGAGSDRGSGDAGADLLLGLAGKDRLVGKRGNDRIGGGAGRDKLYGQGNKDFLAASDDGRDLVHGGAGHRDRARVDGKRGKGRHDQVRKVELLNAR